MNESSFASVRGQLNVACELAADYYDHCCQFLDEIKNIAPAIGDECEVRRNELAQALALLHKELSTPVIRLAAIGTTSSAKSSLLNFLCGHDLLPTGVQEKSAGITRVIHAPEPGLIIEPTEGARWTTGPIAMDEPEKEIREILEEVMDYYRKAIDDHPEMEAPAFTVLWPIMAHPLLDIPEGCAFELLDLPGLLYTGDERHRRVMAECRDSLCMVAFSAHETDPVKQDAVLDDVMEKVGAIGSPLERMFFVATRVDEFLLKDQENWPDNEDDYLADRLAAIKKRLSSSGSDPDKLALGRISPLPALLSMKLIRDDDDRFEAWRKIRAGFMGLVEGGKDRDPYNGLDTELDMSSHSFRMWNDEDWEKVHIQLVETTGAAEFLTAIRKRLARNLPAIILPPACSRFLAAAEDLAQWLRSGAELAKTAIRGDAQRQVEILDNALREQDEINGTACGELEEFLSGWTNLAFSSGNTMESESGLDDFFARHPHFDLPELRELARGPAHLEKSFLKPWLCVRKRLCERMPLPETVPLRARLEKVCSDLSLAGYNPACATNGMEKNADAENIEKLDSLFTKMQAICEESSRLSSDSAFNLLLEKTFHALNGLQVAYLDYLNMQAELLPLEIRNVGQVTPHGLKKFRQSKIAHSRIARKKAQVGHHIEEEIREQSNWLETGNALSRIVVNSWRWVTGTDVIRKVIRRHVHHITLPPMDEVVRNYASGFQDDSASWMKTLQDAVNAKMVEFMGNISEYQAALYAAYRQNLDRTATEKFQDAGEIEKSLDTFMDAFASAQESLVEMRKMYP